MGKSYAGSSLPTTARVATTFIQQLGAFCPERTSWKYFSRGCHHDRTRLTRVFSPDRGSLRTGDCNRLVHGSKGLSQSSVDWPHSKAVHMCIRLLNRKALGQRGSKLRHPEPRVFLNKVYRSYFLFAPYFTGMSSLKKKIISQGS